MTDNMSHDDYVAFQRRRAAAIASEMLCGAMGMIEGSRSLLSLRPEVEVAEDDPDFRVFIAIVGEERRGLRMRPSAMPRRSPRRRLMPGGRE